MAAYYADDSEESKHGLRGLVSLEHLELLGFSCLRRGKILAYPLAAQVPTLCVADSHSEPSCLRAADSSVVLSQDIVETDHMHNILTES